MGAVLFRSASAASPATAPRGGDGGTHRWGRTDAGQGDTLETTGDRSPLPPPPFHSRRSIHICCRRRLFHHPPSLRPSAPQSSDWSHLPAFGGCSVGGDSRRPGMFGAVGGPCGGGPGIGGCVPGSSSAGPAVAVRPPLGCRRPGRPGDSVVAVDEYEYASERVGGDVRTGELVRMGGAAELEGDTKDGPEPVGRVVRAGGDGSGNLAGDDKRVAGGGGFAVPDAPVVAGQAGRPKTRAGDGPCYPQPGPVVSPSGHPRQI